MARQRRTWRPGAGQHVISRFVDRRYKLETESDRRHYLSFIELANRAWDWKWLSYCLMSSHVHDGLIAGVRPLDPFYRRVHVRYAKYYQHFNQSLGPVFAGRPKNCEVRAGELLRMVAYQHRNPVEAGVVDRASASTWSSHRAYLRLDAAPDFLDIEWAMDTLGFDDTLGGRRAFDEFVNDFDFTKTRDCTFEALYSSDSNSRNFDRADKCIVRERTDPAEHRWQELLCVTSAQVGIEPEELLASGTHLASRARRLLVHAAVYDLGWSIGSVAQLLGKSLSGVSHLLHRGGSYPPEELQADLLSVSHLLSSDS